MKNFESISTNREERAAKAKAAEQAYVNQKSSTSDNKEEVRVAELLLETPEQEQIFIDAAKKRTEGNINDLKISEAELQENNTKKGVMDEVEMRSQGKNFTKANEFFGTQELDPMIESNEQADARLATQKTTKLDIHEANYAQRGKDMKSLRSHIEIEPDPILRAAQMKVLYQLEREQTVAAKEIEELKKAL